MLPLRRLSVLVVPKVFYSPSKSVKYIHVIHSYKEILKSWNPCTRNTILAGLARDYWRTIWNISKDDLFSVYTWTINFISVTEFLGFALFVEKHLTYAGPLYCIIVFVCLSIHPRYKQWHRMRQCRVFFLLSIWNTLSNCRLSCFHRQIKNKISIIIPTCWSLIYYIRKQL